MIYTIAYFALRNLRNAKYAIYIEFCKFFNAKDNVGDFAVMLNIISLISQLLSLLSECKCHYAANK